MANPSGSEIVAELAPLARLRAGVVVGTHAGLFFVELDEAPAPARGVTVDLFAALARDVELPLDLCFFPNSGDCTDALEAGDIDVAFMPVDAQRRERVAFGPAYFALRSTYLVTAASRVSSLPEVDQPHIRVVGIANTTTIRAATRTLGRTVPIAARSVEEAEGMLRDGSADAFALSHDSLKPFALALPGSRILDGSFQETTISIAVPRDRPLALACVSAFLSRAKASGLVRAAFERVGHGDELVAAD